MIRDISSVSVNVLCLSVLALLIHDIQLPNMVEPLNVTYEQEEARHHYFVNFFKSKLADDND